LVSRVDRPRHGRPTDGRSSAEGSAMMSTCAIGRAIWDVARCSGATPVARCAGWVTSVLAIETDSIGSLERVGYRFEVQRPDGEFVIEQQAYFATDGEKISWLRIMCTGFLPRG
jgi:hypothetical protein